MSLPKIIQQPLYGWRHEAERHRIFAISMYVPSISRSILKLLMYKRCRPKGNATNWKLDPQFPSKYTNCLRIERGFDRLRVLGALKTSMFKRLTIFGSETFYHYKKLASAVNFIKTVTAAAWPTAPAYLFFLLTFNEDSELSPVRLSEKLAFNGKQMCIVSSFVWPMGIFEIFETRSNKSYSKQWHQPIHNA